LHLVYIQVFDHSVHNRNRAQHALNDQQPRSLFIFVMQSLRLR
jgi:hypothetical protein